MNQQIIWIYLAILITSWQVAGKEALDFDRHGISHIDCNSIEFREKSRIDAILDLILGGESWENDSEAIPAGGTRLRVYKDDKIMAIFQVQGLAIYTSWSNGQKVNLLTSQQKTALDKLIGIPSPQELIKAVGEENILVTPETTNTESTKTDVKLDFLLDNAPLPNAIDLNNLGGTGTIENVPSATIDLQSPPSVDGQTELHIDETTKTVSPSPEAAPPGKP